MRKALIILFMLTLIISNVSASEATELPTDSLVEELPEDAIEIMEGIGPDSNQNFLGRLVTMLQRAIRYSTKSLRTGVRLCMIILSISLMTGLLSLWKGSFPGAKMLGVLAIVGCITSSLTDMVHLAQSTMEDLTQYGAILLPVLASSLAACGAPASAAVLQGGTVLFCQLLMRLTQYILIPGIYGYLLISCAEACLDHSILSEIRELLAWLISKTLRIILYVFTAYISITGVISGTGDALAVKATKAAISGMIPVVGNIISDASEALLSGAAIVRNSIGVFGLLAVLGICILPFLKVGIHYLLMKLTAALSSAIGGKGQADFLKNVTTAMGFLLGMTGSCALMLLISGICFLKVIV